MSELIVFSEGKRNSWNVTISPNDVPGVQALNFSIFNNGTAVLNVTNTYSDPITFYGYLQPVEHNNKPADQK